jgi:hypothetical protein
MHYRTILNAIHIPAFVLDEHVEILDLNGAAAQFCGRDHDEVYRLHGSDVLHCLHAGNVGEGCERRPLCENCVIRDSVLKCLEGQRVSRKIMGLQVVHEEVAKEVQILITASPISGSEKRLALVMVEDITERQKAVQDTGSTAAAKNKPVDWQPRSRALCEFPEDAQVRLRQLDFNRTITVCAGEKALYVRRVGLNQFLWCEAA